jgi:hypothetical protein
LLQQIAEKKREKNRTFYQVHIKHQIEEERRTKAILNNPQKPRQSPKPQQISPRNSSEMKLSSAKPVLSSP